MGGVSGHADAITHDMAVLMQAMRFNGGGLR